MSDEALVHGAMPGAAALESADVSPTSLLEQVVAAADPRYPAYACNQYFEVLAWNRAACEWYDDWGSMPAADRNIMRWILTSPVAQERLVDWETIARDVMARWRSECARHPGDVRIARMIESFERISPDFAAWWRDHEVLEHRTGLRRLRHPDHGIQQMRIVPLLSPEFTPCGVALHLPAPPIP